MFATASAGIWSIPPLPANTYEKRSTRGLFSIDEVCGLREQHSVAL